jgi:hypothetical protein
MGSTESWLYRKDGKVYRHIENDGWSFLRRGPEASERSPSPGEEMRVFNDRECAELQKSTRRRQREASA